MSKKHPRPRTDVVWRDKRVHFFGMGRRFNAFRLVRTLGGTYSFVREPDEDVIQ